MDGVKEAARSLLAVDLGLKAGVARYGGDGRLVAYRSTNFGSRERLKRGLGAVLDEAPGLAVVVVEGDRHLAALWEREATRRGARCVAVSPEQWRALLLNPSARRSGADAKESADALARRVIAWSGAPRPTSLRHDAAEAILIGLWGVIAEGWLPTLPPELAP